ncbi:YoqO family protein [Bacillus sp. CLL-7-23]|uniref:YoqO family protein n=1 Tax=Bacillus changyiensis TaxID=3004103 RepID=A0ABT4X5Z2_9BACI|nr:YoqO family protein [Bacillus changyiensis]MDA7027705.1 YoqO family protein [Bacillus changyiensis]
MIKKIGFYGFLSSVLLNIFLTDSFVSDVMSIASFVFILLYMWDLIKKETVKVLVLKGIMVVISAFLLAFVIMEGQKFISSLTFLNGWEILEKIIYILFMLILISIPISYINNKLEN